MKVFTQKTYHWYLHKLAPTAGTFPKDLLAASSVAAEVAVMVLVRGECLEKF